MADSPSASVESPQPRIAFYLPALAAGGMERVTLVLAEALTTRGFAVDIVLERGEGGYFDRVPDSVGRIVLSSGPKWPAYRRLIRAWPREGAAQLVRQIGKGHNYVPLRRLLSLVAYMERARPAAVFAAHGRIPHLALWAARIASTSPRVAVIEHSTYSRWLDAFSQDRRTHSVLCYRLSLMRRLYPRADAIVGVSEGVSADLAAVTGISRDRIATIYNPVVTPELAQLVEQPVDHPWLEPDQPPVVLAAGRLVEEKDFATLIRAFALARRRGTAARLLILGDGEQRSRLRACAEQHGVADETDMPGWIDNPYAYMARAGVFVLSSIFEGLPVALIEALACGCPVAATDCPSGPREILENGAYGRLVPVGNAQALAEAIQGILSSPPPRERQTARGAYFGVERAATAYHVLINRMIDHDE